MRSPQDFDGELAVGVPDGLRHSGSGIEEKAEAAEKCFAECAIALEVVEQAFVAFGDVEKNGGGNFAKVADGFFDQAGSGLAFVE